MLKLCPHADGRSVSVVHDTGNSQKYPGIITSEGLAYPLIMGATMFAHTLEMPAGLTVPEHAEAEESMVYTVRGRWILVVDGQKHLMGPGSLHWINEGAYAGCEVPFDEPAFVLAFMRVKAGGDRLATPLSVDNIIIKKRLINV
jgi:quercetin dioxygenase-like cupin family protein